MTARPRLLQEARALVARVRTGHPIPPVDELDGLVARLRSLAAHPSTGEEVRGEVAGAVLLLEVLRAAAPEPVQLAG